MANEKLDSNIVVPESYMQKLNRTEEGVRLPDGSGYLATLNVHHELHCVVSLTPSMTTTLNSLLITTTNQFFQPGTNVQMDQHGRIFSQHHRNRNQRPKKSSLPLPRRTSPKRHMWRRSFYRYHAMGCETSNTSCELAI